MLSLSVPSKIDLPLERLVAEAALERFVACVLAHVRDQIAALGERLAADHAFVRLLAWNRIFSRVREREENWREFLEIY